MTSLDFQSLLKQEKALRRAELIAKQRKNAAQPHQEPSVNTPRTDGAGSSADRCGDAPQLSCTSPCVESKVELATDDAVRQKEPPLSFAELADRLPLDMDKIKVGNTPTVFYAPNFVSEADEQTILARTYANPLSLEDADPRSEWVALRSRRLKCWGGQPGKHFRPEPLPPWVEALCDALVERGVFTSEGRPNHVLLNEYQPGQGIMPHTDGPFYAPRTATLSLGSDAIMHFSPRVAAADIGQSGVDTRPQSSLVLRARCLVVFADDAYSRMLHGIDAVGEEAVGARGAPVVNADSAGAPEGTVIRRKLRVSLTFRRVCAAGAADGGGKTP